ncbi:MAG: site-2 protease family protein [Chloroflexi bacterium]|nr:site-2 protease family protein [Chloroflexota bacterium]
MNSGINLGKIFGININIDWSWIFIFLLVTWNLAVGIFPSVHPEWQPGLTWSVAILASILFFASVLVHELAHSVVALARGLPVRRITLFLFGGVSNIQREPTSPWTEFLMAIVGPLISVILGIFFLFLGDALSGFIIIPSLGNPLTAISDLNPISTLLFWLGPINIILGVFNMVPGFPLDGGRVLRSLLWGATGNLRLATRWATRVGQLIAWVFIILGISMVFGLQIPILGTGLISGVWLAIIGWFLMNAATQSYERVVIQNLLEGIPVSRLMRTNVRTVPPDLYIQDLVDHYIMATDERSFPVISENDLVGLVSLEDVRKVPREQWDRTRVESVMTPRDKLSVTSPIEDLSVVMERLSEKDVRQMPVIQDGLYVGIIRRQDIMRWLQLQSNTPSHIRTNE